MPTDVPTGVLEDAIDNYQFWIVPHLPPVSEGNPENRRVRYGRDADALAAGDSQVPVRRRRVVLGPGAVAFGGLSPRLADRGSHPGCRSASGPSVPMCGTASGVSRSRCSSSARTAIRCSHARTRQIRSVADATADPRFRNASFNWTWIQTHIPDWQFRMLYDRPPRTAFPDPVGPQPEQIRLLTYMAIASGCKGLGFWSDRFLADSHLGRDRLLQLALAESGNRDARADADEPQWRHSLDHDVEPVRESGRHANDQQGTARYPDLGRLRRTVRAAARVGPSLTFTVPLQPDGSEPWEITPVRVQSLQAQMRRRRRNANHASGVRSDRGDRVHDRQLDPKAFSRPGRSTRVGSVILPRRGRATLPKSNFARSFAFTESLRWLRRRSNKPAR